MKIRRDLHGRELAAALCRSWGYEKFNQVGSHIIFQTENPLHHRLSVPDHKLLRMGTRKAILPDVAWAKHVTREEFWLRCEMQEGPSGPCFFRHLNP